MVDLNKIDLSLFILKYKIKVNDFISYLNQCISSKASISSL